MPLREDLPEEDLPREKLVRWGASKLTVTELLALILRTGTKNQHVLSLSRDLLDAFPLAQLSTLGVEELSELGGISKGKASVCVAAFELGRRTMELSCSGYPLMDADAVFHYARHWFQVMNERIVVIHVTTKNTPIKTELVSEGSLESAVLDVRLLIKRALLLGASGFFLLHNHPSGDVSPSADDLEVTKKVSDAAKVMQLRLLDHLIIGRNTYYSFFEHDSL